MPQWLVHNHATPLRLSNYAPVYTETPHWSTPLNLHHQIRKDLLGGFYNSEFASSDRSLLPCLGMTTHEAMIGNISLILKDIAESTVKAIVASPPPQILRLCGQAVPDNRIALDYL